MTTRIATRALAGRARARTRTPFNDDRHGEYGRSVTRTVTWDAGYVSLLDLETRDLDRSRSRCLAYGAHMCRSIQQLRGAEPPATDEEIRDAALQYVRKISGYRSPSAANAEAFDAAVASVAAATRHLLEDLVVAPGSKPGDPVQRRIGR